MRREEGWGGGGEVSLGRGGEENGLAQKSSKGGGAPSKRGGGGGKGEAHPHIGFDSHQSAMITGERDLLTAPWKRGGWGGEKMPIQRGGKVMTKRGVPPEQILRDIRLREVD